MGGASDSAKEAIRSGPNVPRRIEAQRVEVVAHGVEGDRRGGANNFTMVNDFLGSLTPLSIRSSSPNPAQIWAEVGDVRIPVCLAVMLTRDVQHRLVVLASRNTSHEGVIRPSPRPPDQRALRGR